ncbi:MAG: RluA family pseudouridine synthase, partial [Proteobacteria bacterium]|nr:RluA family pseudouridine synthase [Pseudomonadota bacterium]
SPQLEGIPRAGIVHRIDKGTTGLLMIAKTLRAHNSLVTQLQEHTVLREYQAIVMGVMTAGGTIDEPIGRHPVERKKQTVIGSGKHAVTHYRVEHRYRAHTHIRCQLETGRTHQIRVHMAHLRYPLLGDPAYGGRLRLPKGASENTQLALQAFKRQALHAGLLGFIHPATEEEVSWRIEMPEDMLNILKVLDRDQKLNT